MRLGRARTGYGERTIVVLGPPDAPDAAAVLPAGAPTVDDAVRDSEAMSRIAELARGAEQRELADLGLVAPLRRFNRDVLCTGWNYWDHYDESSGKREGQDPVERPTHPTFFTKAPGAVVGPHDEIAFDPQLSGKYDYEAELAIVIGKAGRSIPEDAALGHIAGALVANDVSQRDLQRAHGGQWMKGKSIDAGSPIGPWLTTPDEIDDLQQLDIVFELNGERMQQANTRQMAFPVARIISELSRGMTLQPGDVVLTGTPSGIGNAREPQVFLKDGDELVTRVSGLGELRNVVARADLTSYLS